MADAPRSDLPPKPRGRGSGINPGNRYESTSLAVDRDQLDADLIEAGAARTSEGLAEREAIPLPVIPTTILDDRTRSIINRVDSPDLCFSWTVNPYRGCEHGCIYCYARPTHEQLGMSCGLDFETKIVAKRDAPELLAGELDAPAWVGEPIVMSGVTDPYQPVERELRITRRCLEVIVERRQPVGLVTKNRLITRDIDLLAELARFGAVGVSVSVTTLDAGLARRMEPRASSPRDRLRAIRELSDAGIPVNVMTSPMIPGLNDHELPSLLRAASDHGATGAGYTLLRLPYQIKEVFLDWLQRERPLAAGKVEAFLREARGGDLYESTWGVRHRGRGARAQQIKDAFRLFTDRYGLKGDRNQLSSGAYRKLDRSGQMTLFSAPGS